MATKQTGKERQQAGIQQRKEKEFRAACKKLDPLPVIAACCLLLALVLMAASWAEVYNTDINGPEVKVSGFSFALAGITRNFSSASKAYGDMAVPFYYYAETYTVKLATEALIAGILLLVGIGTQILARLKGAALNVPAAVVSLLAAVMILVCLFTARAMNGSDILPYYCNSNPACSIRSYAIFPAIFAFIAAGFNVFACVKYFQARKAML